MRTNTAINTSRSVISKTTIVAAIATLAFCWSHLTLAQGSQPRTFASPSEASRALYEAAKNNDDPALDAILGAGPELTSSGSDNDDKLNRERFVQKYQEMHRLVQEPDGTTALYVGAENWPFPVPLVSKGGKWYFDSDEGGQEVLARQIGQNEITAIEVCHAFEKVSGSDVGSATGENSIREFASALADNTNPKSADGTAFHGYYFKSVAAKPGSVVLLAYPAEYRSSGVMTFIVTGSGSVYEKDLGPQTPTLAKQFQGKPTGGWVAVQPGSML
jgi:hypothetical protein